MNHPEDLLELPFAPGERLGEAGLEGGGDGCVGVLELLSVVKEAMVSKVSQCRVCDDNAMGMKLTRASRKFGGGQKGNSSHRDESLLSYL